MRTTYNQGCGEEMRADKRRRHHETACPMRYLPCPLGCPKKVRCESLVSCPLYVRYCDGIKAWRVSLEKNMGV